MTDRRASPRSTPKRRVADPGGPRERRAGPRRGALRRDDLHVEALEFRAAVVHRGEWASLAARAIEPNPFFEPAYLLPALHRLPRARQPLLLVVRKRVAGRMRLIGLLPVAPVGSRFSLAPVRAWRPPLASLGAPLLDHDHAQDALRGLLTYASARAGVRGLHLHGIEREGPIAGLLARLSSGSKPALKAFNVRSQPALLAGSDFRSAIAATFTQDLARRGDLDFVLHEGEAVLDALERLLALEALKKDGRDPQAAGGAAMARAFTFALAREQGCAIGEVTRDGAPVAAAVAVISGDLAVVWKVACAPNATVIAADTMAILHLAGALMARPRIARVYCQADAARERVAAFWTGRVDLADYLVPGLREDRSQTHADLEATPRSGMRDGVTALFRRLSRRGS